MLNFNSKEVDILGSTWTIKIVDDKDDPILEDRSGYMDGTIRTIIISSCEVDSQDKFAVKDLARYQKRALRHEIIHAFLYESGLDGDSNECEHWACNEEMVDWMAAQLPKINKVCDQTGCSDGEETTKLYADNKAAEIL